MGHARDGGDYGSLCENRVLSGVGIIGSGREDEFRRELSTHGATSLKYLVGMSDQRVKAGYV